ncbi:MAG: hypothetical protein K9J21_11525 [Bacteroidales bacterium]|nr:hypothetical protein [Bacteroidales bacterium]
MERYFYNMRKTPMSFVISGTFMLAIAIAVVPANYALAVLFFLLAVGFWLFKEGIEIDFSNQRFRKVLFIWDIKTGKWYPMDDIQYASPRHVKGKKWSVNLHFSDTKFYQLFTADEDTCKTEAAKIQQELKKH